MTVTTVEDATRLKNSCRMAAALLAALREMLRPGLETRELDSQAEWLLVRWGGRSAFKGYRGFPSNVCVSINEEVVHGLPGKRKLKEGDLVSLDVGVLYEGFYGDNAVCQAVGRVDDEGQRLIRVTEEALHAGIAQAQEGNHVSDISSAVQKHAEREGFSVVREFVGHGIGRQMHEEPQIPNFGEPGHGMKLKRGQALAIEPMINEGGPGVRVLQDGWTAVTVDGKRSGHFEHTVLVTERGPEILTIPAKEGES